MPKYKLAAFDMDGTLLKGEPSWLMLHRHFGTIDIAEEAHRSYVNGEITYEDFMKLDLTNWPKPLHRSTLERVLMRYELREEAPYVISKLKEAGLKVAIITAGLDLLADRVAQRLGIDIVLANRLGFDEAGFFNGKLYPLVEPLRKHEQLESLAKELSISLEEIVAVGDSEYDASFLKMAGLGIVVNDRELGRRLNLVCVKDLREILNFIR